MFVSSSLSYNRREDLSICVDKCESLWLELDNFLPHHNKTKTIVGTVYRSPSCSAVDFCNSFKATLEKISAENKNALILGDFNINLLDDSCPGHVDFTNCFNGFGFESLVNVPTRCVPHNMHSLLDTILSNVAFSPNVGVAEVNITDHYPVFCYFDLHNNSNKTNYVTAKLDMQAYTDEIARADFTAILSSSDAELAFDKFVHIITSAVRACTKNLTTKRYQAPRCPWISPSLLESLRKKDNLYKKTKRQSFNTRLLHRYKLLSEHLNKALKNAKKMFF